MGIQIKKICGKEKKQKLTECAVRLTQATNEKSQQFLMEYQDKKEKCQKRVNQLCV